jgi:hypothetical protein
MVSKKYASPTPSCYVMQSLFAFVFLPYAEIESRSVASV